MKFATSTSSYECVLNLVDSNLQNGHIVMYSPSMLIILDANTCLQSLHCHQNCFEQSFDLHMTFGSVIAVTCSFVVIATSLNNETLFAVMSFDFYVYAKYFTPYF